MESKILTNCDGTFWIPSKEETFEDFLARLENRVKETKMASKKTSVFSQDDSIFPKQGELGEDHLTRLEKRQPSKI